MCSIADALNPNCSVTIFPLFSFLTRKLHSHWITHLSVLLTASYMLPSVFLLCANMTALHLKMPHKLFWCLSDPLEIQWKLAHPQPTPTSLSSGLCHCECYNTHSFRTWLTAWMLFTLHASVKPSYRPPVHTACFIVLTQGKQPLCIQPFHLMHTPVHKETHKLKKRRHAISKHILKSP